MSMSRGGQAGDAMQALDQWREYMQASGHSPATIKLYVRIIETFGRHAGCKPEAATRQDAIRFLARPMKAWSRLTYWKVLHRWANYLIEFGHRSDDLLKGLPRPMTPDPIARPLTDETISQLLQARLSPRASAYVRLALFAGLRVHEIARVRGEDFDWAAGWLIVTGKGGRTAPIPIHPELVRLGDHMPEFGFWFPSHSNPGRPVAPTSVTLTIGAALKSIGCTATAHQLRDSCGTRMQRQVKDIRLTQTMLRHRSLRSTQKYTEVANADMQAAVLSLDWARHTA